MNFLYNMKVAFRIALLAAMLLLLLIISAFFGLSLTSDSNEGLRTVYIDRVVPLKQLKIISDEYAVNIVDTSHKVRSGALSWNQGLNNLDTAQQKISKELGAYLSTTLVPDEQRLVDDLKPKLAKADTSISQLRSIFQSQNSDKLINYINKELYPVIDPVTEVIANLIDVQLIVAENVYKEAETAYSTGRKLMFLLVIFAAVIAAVITFVIGKSLTRQLGDEPGTIQRIASRIAAGDLEAAKEIDRGKAHGVSLAMLEINDSLSSISEEIKESVAKIRYGHLRFRGDTAGLEGFFASLMENINLLADSLVNFMDELSTPLMCIDKDFNITFMNSSGAELGNKKPSDLLGSKCYDHFKTSDCQTQNCACEIAMKQNRQANRQTDAHPGKHSMEIQYTSIPITDNNGNIVGAFESIIDQTDTFRMQRKITDLAEKASAISDNLESAAADLNIRVDEANQGARVQSERTAETATAMEEMNATVLEVAQNAGKAAENTGLTREKAQTGSEVVDKVVDAIGQVQRQADTLKIDTEAMGKQAEGIGNIIEVISDIADQTNLLALNAAIEAARAGEAGRGFAVVADEVRKLAEKTMTATTEVNAAINAIQSSSRKNISSTESTVKIVGTSTELAGQAGTVLKEIVAFSDSSSEQVQSIAAASEQQSATAEQITRSTEDVDRISQETSATMAEAAMSVEKISAMISELNELIQAMVSE